MEQTPLEKIKERESQKKKNKNNISRKKKKRSRFFESYINKILHQVSPENKINTNAKQQLNTALCHICRIICDQSTKLSEYASKKTVDIEEIKNSLATLISGELLKHCIKEGDSAVERYKEFNQTKITLGTRMPATSRSMQADIILQPSIIERFLRRFGYSKSMVTANSPIFLAAVMEYITAEILNISSIKAQETCMSRITVRHMELGVRNDPDFYKLFQKLNLKFLGSGFTPGIHKELLIKKKTKKKYVKEPNKEVSKKTKRYKPGTIALKEIKKYQKNGNLMLARTPFERLVRSFFEETKISKEVFVVLQYFVEQNVIQTLRLANLISIHSKHTKLTNGDILLTRFIASNNYNFPLDRYENFINQMDSLSLNSTDSPQDENTETQEVGEEEKIGEEEEEEKIGEDYEPISSSENSEEDEVPTEDSDEEFEYTCETDFLETDTEMPWAGPRYLKSRTRTGENKIEI
jgi:histone H3/H4